jgi:hypothetical protein
VTLETTAQGGHAKSYADLSTGKIGVFASSVDRGNAGGGAIIADLLTFNVAGASAETITPLRLLLSVHGANPKSVLGFSFQLGRALYDQFSPLDVAGSTNGNWSSFSTWMDGDTRYFDATYALRGATQTLGFQMGMSVGVANGAVADFYHTAGVKFETSPNIAFTSPSGQFLSAAPGVPEPATWAMMIGGFGVVGAASRCRSRAQVPYA